MRSPSLSSFSSCGCCAAGVAQRDRLLLRVEDHQRRQTLIGYFVRKGAFFEFSVSIASASSDRCVTTARLGVAEDRNISLLRLGESLRVIVVDGREDFFALREERGCQRKKDQESPHGSGCCIFSSFFFRLSMRSWSC
jgi:hypothetical protein